MRFGWMGLLALLVMVQVSAGRSNYTGYSGAPGRQTCASSCHGGSNGTVTVSGFPELYTPGTPYTVTLTRASGSTIRSFNGSCRLGTGTANAGVISGGPGTITYNVTGETNGVRCSTYGVASCSFTWTAPAAGSGTARLYVAAYQGSGENGQTTALTLVAQEGQSGELALEISAVAVLADSDGDGLAENGESVSLELSVRNNGGFRVNNPTGLLTVLSPHAQMIQPESDWPDIPAGQTRVNETAFELVVDPGLAGDVTVPLTLALTTEEGDVELEGELVLHYQAPPAPELVALPAAILWDTDGDGVLEPGETAQLAVALLNMGGQTLSGLQATLASGDPWLTVVDSTSSYPDLIAQGQESNLTPYAVTLSADCPPLYEAWFVLQVQTDQGPGGGISVVEVGGRETTYATGFEDGAGDWSHSSAEGWGDAWHLAETGSGSPVMAWRCGGEGGGNYPGHLDARLESPELNLLPWSRLEFQHSMAAEISGAWPDSAYDGGLVEASVDGGASWQQLTPYRSDYTHTFRHLTGAGNPTTHPFGGGVRGWSGSIGWETVTMDLSGLGENPVRLRFRFGSDDGTGAAGWVVDDVRVYGLAEDTFAEPAGLRPQDVQLLPAWPNPFNPVTRLAWTQREAGPVQLELFNLAGGRVARLAEGVHAAGRHEVSWEAAGQASGCYLLRLEAAGQVRTGKLLLVR
jgi:hypothetical protein